MVKPTAVNDSERILHHLGTRTFLSLWSITNPKVNRGPKTPPGELCDLLVIYENHILIFSDKYNHLDPNAGKLDPEKHAFRWKRWYRDAIKESIKQVYGAERKIKEDPGKIYLDPQLTLPLTDRLPDPKHMVVHRIIVANGAGPYLKNQFGRSGSLKLELGPHHDLGFPPGLVTTKDMAKGFVHVFDEQSIQLVMHQLDTITDFVEYLSCKEALASSTGVRIAFEEQDLLGSYFQGYETGTGYGFTKLAGSNRVQDGLWQDWIHSGRVDLRTQENQHSYHWDHLIEALTQAFLNQNMYFKNDLNFQEAEMALRALASARRLHRRSLGAALYGAQLKSHQYPGQPLYRPLRNNLAKPGDPSFYILAMAHSHSNLDLQAYRERRRLVLHVYLGDQLRKYPDAPVIVGIGVSGWEDQEHTYDLLYVKPSLLSQDQLKAIDDNYEDFLQSTTLASRSSRRIKTEDFPKP